MINPQTKKKSQGISNIMYIYISPRYIMIRLFKTKRKILKPGTGKNSTLCTKEKIRMTENFFSEVIKANGL